MGGNPHHASPLDRADFPDNCSACVHPNCPGPFCEGWRGHNWSTAWRAHLPHLPLRLMPVFRMEEPSRDWMGSDADTPGPRSEPAPRGRGKGEWNRSRSRRNPCSLAFSALTPEVIRTPPLGQISGRAKSRHGRQGFRKVFGEHRVDAFLAGRNV